MVQSIRLVLPTSARTLSSSMSLVASAATCWGLVCSDSTTYLIGRPLMPPLSFTHEKYACDMPVMPVKSVPGCLVTIAPSVSGVPVAFWLLPRPHFEEGALLFEAVPPPEVPLLPPHAATRTETQAISAATVDRDLGEPNFVLKLFISSCFLGAMRKRPPVCSPESGTLLPSPRTSELAAPVSLAQAPEPRQPVRSAIRNASL